MKHISELMRGAIGGQRETKSPSISAEAQSLVDLLFIAFEEHVKYFRLNHLHTNDEAKREWTKTFMACGISKERVQKGIARLRTNGVVYSTITPGEFLELCSPSHVDAGAPDTESAFMQACYNSSPTLKEKKWAHPAVRYAAHKTGSYNLVNLPRKETFSAFSANYQIGLQQYMDGRIMNQLENDSHDTPDNRVKYQDYFGSAKIGTKLSYQDWLKEKPTGREGKIGSPKEHLAALKEILK